MAVNKVEANGETLIDLTNDTVTADTLVEGRTAHLANGEQVTGTFTPVTGVKGNAETSYRTGNVNLTPANVGAVNKSGDTMSGPLTHNGTYVFLKATNLDLNGDNPTSNTWSNAPIEYRDKDNARMGYVTVQRRTDGSTRLEIGAQARNTADTADISNTIDMFVGRDGSRSYTVADPAAFRSAINAASKDQVNYNTNNGVKNLLYTAPITHTAHGITISRISPNKYSVSGTTTSSGSTKLLITNLSTAAIRPDNSQYPVSGEYAPGDYIASVRGIPAGIDLQIITASSIPLATSNYRVHHLNSANPVLKFTLAANEKYLWFMIAYKVTSVTTFNDEFEIMLRSATIEDSTFEPYAEPNYQLTQKVDKALEQTGYNLLEITNDTQTINGVTFIVNREAGTITANGTATGSTGTFTRFDFYANANLKGNYYISGCPSTGNGSTYNIRIGNYDTSYLGSDTGTGLTINLSSGIRLGIMIAAGVTVSNIVFKPMIVPAELAGVPFQPYAKSNAELTADIPLTIHIDYSNIDAHTCDSTYNECLSALESGRAVIAMIQITSKLMRTCFFGLDTDTKIICGEIPNGNTTYDFDWRAGEDCPSIGISS